MVLSTKAHAKIIKLDGGQALAMPGVVAFFTYKDVNPEHFIQEDISMTWDRVFAQEKVNIINIKALRLIPASVDILVKFWRPVNCVYESYIYNNTKM